MFTRTQYFVALGVAAALMAMVPIWLMSGGHFAEGVAIGVPTYLVLAVLGGSAWALVEQ